MAGSHSIAAYGAGPEGEARVGLGRVLRALGQGEAARAELERAVALLTRAHGESSQEVLALRALLDR